MSLLAQKLGVPLKVLRATPECLNKMAFSTSNEASQDQQSNGTDAGSGSSSSGATTPARTRSRRGQTKAVTHSPRASGGNAVARRSGGGAGGDSLMDLRRGIDDIFRNFERDFFGGTAFGAPLTSALTSPLASPLARMLDSPFAAPLPIPLGTAGLLESIPLPSMNVDIKQTDTHYILKMELPGVSKDDMKIEVDDDAHTVTITTEQKGDTTEEGEDTSSDESEDRFLHRERAWGRAQRTIHFPDDAELDKAQEVELKNGVLIFNVPKKEGSTREKRKLQIKE